MKVDTTSQNDFKPKLLELAKEIYQDDDPSHDILHIFRVLKNAEMLQAKEGGDLDIITAAVIFHDSVNYAKDDPRAPNATDESAEKAIEMLNNLAGFPKEKIEKVAYAVKVCSFTKNIKAETLEAKILQDADMLESTGAVSIMRIFASSGSMKRRFYDPEDPFGEHGRELKPTNTIDMFNLRLLLITDRMNTETGKNLAREREVILKHFLSVLKSELN